MVTNMTDKSQKQLKFMFSCIFDGATHPKVTTSVATNGCRVASATVDTLGECRLMEQNPRSASLFATAAQQGYKLAWLMNDQPRGYLGPVLLFHNGAIQILQRESAKQLISKYLNPLQKAA